MFRVLHTQRYALFYLVSQSVTVPLDRCKSVYLVFVQYLHCIILVFLFCKPTPAYGTVLYLVICLSSTAVGGAMVGW